MNILKCRLTASSSSTTVCSSRLAAEGKSHVDSYSEASTSSSSDGTLLSTSGSPSTSTHHHQQINTEIHGAMDQMNCQKLDQKIDIDDTCSNDAFVFNSSLKGKPLKSNQKTATAPYNGPK